MFTNEQGRPLGKVAPKVTGALNAVDASTIADPGDGVVDLASWRRRRLLAPWPGWWGGAEVRSWTYAERSRRPA